MTYSRRPGSHRPRGSRRGNVPRNGGRRLTATPVVILSAQPGSVTLRMPVVVPVVMRSPAADSQASAPTDGESRFVRPHPSPANPEEESSEAATDDAVEEWTIHPGGPARRARLFALVVATLAAAAILIVVVGSRRSMALAVQPSRVLVQASSDAATPVEASAVPVPVAPPSSSSLVSAPEPEPRVAPLPAPVATPPPPRETATGAKLKARAALEGGALAKAAAAGERSVALDPGDAEAWLILGAAYDMLGRGSDAHRAYASCVRRAQVGPVSECRSLVH
jgi:hypothetical protein